MVKSVRSRISASVKIVRSPRSLSILSFAYDRDLTCHARIVREIFRKKTRMQNFEIRKCENWIFASRMCVARPRRNKIITESNIRAGLKFFIRTAGETQLPLATKSKVLRHDGIAERANEARKYPSQFQTTTGTVPPVPVYRYLASHYSRSYHGRFDLSCGPPRNLLCGPSLVVDRIPAVRRNIIVPTTGRKVKGYCEARRDQGRESNRDI